MKQAVANALGQLGGKSRQLEGQQDFLTTLKATKEEVIGGYVDADLATESCKTYSIAGSATACSSGNRYC